MLQCVADSVICDDVKQCEDETDEEHCELPRLFLRSKRDLPILVDFHKTGEVTITTLHPEKNRMDVECPETHFWCTDRDYCLPVFVRCNGVYDCPGHEDEEGCDVYTCPGFYRCRASKVCLHVTHVCDDRPLCPQHDDELLCNRPCPRQCTCLGLAFFCGHLPGAHVFPDLRYLDMKDGRINLHLLSNNSMLIHLGLSRCGIKSVTNLTLLNLHSLDLSDNLLTEVSAHHLRHMPQLTVLFLAGNPLTSGFTSFTKSSTMLHKINFLDMSRVKMRFVHHSLFLTFPCLQFLNLSHSGVELVQWNISQMSVASLQELDLRGYEIAEFPLDVLRGFLHLQLLYADNFKWCCPVVLPQEFEVSNCHMTPDDVSSCDNLLGSDSYRTTLAIVTTLALSGNIISLTVRMCVRSTWRLSASGVVLTHLSVADLGMGIHLATLGLADHLLAGHYVRQDDSWRTGTVCHLAGALAMSCRHAASCFITILTLDRCLHLYPALTPCFTLFKVKALCLAVWVSSFLLAIVPLMSQWRFFGHHALCLPLPHKRDNSLESHYAYGVMVLAQFFMSVLCCVCKIVSAVYSRVTKSSNRNEDTSSNDFQFVVFGSLTSGFLYTIACLLPTDPHSDKQKATHTALVYFGFVVSSAMNPYLHLYGTRVQRRKRIKRERLLRIVSRARV